MKSLSAAVLLSLALIPAAPARSSPAQSPTPQQLSNLRLHDGFTLTYQVTVRDVRTAALREKDKAEQQAGVAKEEAAGRIAPSMRESFEKQALTLSQQRPDERFTVTLSANDGKLLYLSTRSGTKLKDGSGQAIVLDGAIEYEADDPMNGMINNDARQTAPAYKNENVDRLDFCPLPGVGLPGVDLVQQPVRAGVTPGGHAHFFGLVPRLNIRDGGSPYKIGEIDTVSVGDHLRVVSLLVGTPAVPLEAWKMTAFRLFQDHWIGTQMQMTQYEAALLSDEEPLSTNQPTSVSTYDLLDAKPVARGSAAFGIETYLSKGASVFNATGSSSLSFTYDPQAGTVKEQAEAALKKNRKKI